RTATCPHTSKPRPSGHPPAAWRDVSAERRLRHWSRYRRRIMLIGMTNAIEHFTARLTFETDVSDVHAALRTGAASGRRDLVVVDSRGPQAWAQGHIPGAVHLPTA